jgi:hypothetical protein
MKRQEAYKRTWRLGVYNSLFDRVYKKLYINMMFKWLKKKLTRKKAAAPAVTLAVGEKAEDGWIYAGISPDTNTPMFVAPADSAAATWQAAVDEANTLCKQGKKDARLPSDRELQMIFNERAKLGAFIETDSYPADHYWSSTPNDVRGQKVVRRFNDGALDFEHKDMPGHPARLVRS